MVEAEEITGVLHEGTAVPIKAQRQRNGVWHVTFRVNVRVLLGDRREVLVTREFRVRATDYKGHPAGKASAKYLARVGAAAQSQENSK